ncbi:MAG: hypothetical protein EP343_24610 [Deltaproteobacteria bacterium]|nr:MAG: hypothetical protein EP343_24610 [Deltaproteobacteria bacterium]
MTPSEQPGITARRPIHDLLDDMWGSNYIKAAKAAKELATLCQPVQIAQISDGLVQMLEYGHWPQPFLMRILIVRTLRDLQAYETADALVPWLKRPEDDDEETAPLQYRLCGEVALTLGSFRDSRLIWTLEEALEEALDHIDAWDIREPDETEWNACNFVLALMDGQSRIADPESLPFLLELLEHRFASVQTKALEVLPQWRSWGEEVLPALEQLLNEEENAAVTEAAVQTASLWGEEAGTLLPVILKVCPRIMPDVALNSLYQMGQSHPKLASYVENVAGSDETDLQGLACHVQLALVPEFVPSLNALLAMLEFSEGQLRHQLLQGLKKPSDDGVHLSPMWWKQVERLLDHMKQRLEGSGFSAMPSLEETEPLEAQTLQLLVMLEKSEKYMSRDEHERFERTMLRMEELRLHFTQHNLDDVRLQWEDSLFEE